MLRACYAQGSKQETCLKVSVDIMEPSGSPVVGKVLFRLSNYSMIVISKLLRFLDNLLNLALQNVFH